MKNKRFRFSYRKSASKLHRAVGEAFRNSNLFRYYEIYQEYPVVKVNPFYSNKRHKFDWVVPGMRLVVECHGKQHEEKVSFGKGQGQKLSERRERDEEKRAAAEEAGYVYFIVWHDELAAVSPVLLEGRYFEYIKKQQK